MSVGTEIFVQRENKDGIVPLDRAVLAEVLGSYAIVRDGKILGAKFSDRDWGDIDGAEELEIEHLCFDGGGEHFLQAIWEFANRTKSYIFWIAEAPCLAVTSDAALKEVPEKTAKDIGPAKIVKNGHELAACIGEADD
jgi:hypothetical protein